MEFLVQKIDIINYLGIIFILSGIILLAYNEYNKIPFELEDIKNKQLSKIIILYTIITFILIMGWEFLFEFFKMNYFMIGNKNG
jgi:predicted transporter